MEVGSTQWSQPAPSVAQPVSSDSYTKAEDRELIKAVKALNAAELFGENNELTFVLDRQTHRVLVRIVDRETKEVVRQIPPEHALRMASDLEPGF